MKRLMADKKRLQILSSCAKSLQAHASIVEAVSETVRGDADDLNESGKEKTNKFALLVAQIKDAAAHVEELSGVKVSHSDSSLLPFSLASLRSRHVYHCLLWIVSAEFLPYMS